MPGRAPASLMAAFEAVTRAQAQGAWTDPATTPAHLHGFVSHAVAKLRRGRRDVFLQHRPMSNVRPGCFRGRHLHLERNRPPSKNPAVDVNLVLRVVEQVAARPEQRLAR